MLSALVRHNYPQLSALLAARARGGTRSRLTLIEKMLQEILMIEVRRILAGYPFTIGIVLAYFVLKGNEIRRIVTVLNAKSYGLGDERIADVA